MSREPPPASARRPLLRDPHARRALVQVGGAVHETGDPAVSSRLAEALRVRAGEDDATLTHPFHAYPARLHPNTARALVRALALPPGATLLDPFCGSGTVLVEALAQGLHAEGRDLSPLAVALAEVKTWRTDLATRRALVRRAYIVADGARDALRDGARFDAPEGEERWFLPHTLRELAALRAALRREHGPVGDALRMLLSSVLVKLSLQRADSSSERVEKHVPPGAALHRFAYKSKELERCLAALETGVPPGATRAVAEDDATALETVPDRSVDGVVTSPPYANTYDYADHHARRYVWLGLDDRAMRAGELGAARDFRDPAEGARRFREGLAAHCEALARVLRDGALALVVLGDGAAGRDVLRADEDLAHAAARAGLRVVAAASQPRSAYDDTSRRAFAHAPRREHVIALTRRGSAAALTDGDSP
jgi:DNA modification methylase